MPTESNDLPREEVPVTTHRPTAPDPAPTYSVSQSPFDLLGIRAVTQPPKHPEVRKPKQERNECRLQPRTRKVFQVVVREEGGIYDDDGDEDNQENAECGDADGPQQGWIQRIHTTILTAANAEKRKQTGLAYENYNRRPSNTL
jgi:hypothetical protein